jgi:hypothetical protein
MDNEERRSRLLGVITPLRLIFCGALLCLFDFSFSIMTNAGSFEFYILNDLLGMILITVGVFRLGAIQVTHTYSTGMAFVMVVSIISTIEALIDQMDALIDHWIFRAPDGWIFFWTFFGLVSLAAIIVFCLCMRLFCREENLDGPSRSWHTTTMLFLFIFVLPLGLFYIAALIAMITGQSFNIDLGPAGLLVLPIFAIPIIHFFVSTSRMAKAAEGISGRDDGIEPLR